MRMRILLAALAALALPAAAQEEKARPPEPPRTEIEELAEAWFYAADVAARDAAGGLIAEAAAAGAPDAVFLRGATEFFATLEAFAGDLARHGFDAPFLDLMGIAANPGLPPFEPAPPTYQDLRDLLTRTREGLLDAAATLDTVPRDADIGIRIDLSRATLSLGLGDALDPALSVGTVLRLGVPGDPADLDFRFDTADAIWLQGYAHILLSLTDFALAHDFEALFDASFQLFFPAGTAVSEPLRPRPGAGFDDPLGLGRDNQLRIADAISFIHLMNLPVIEPGLRAGARDHLLEVVRLSRENWRAILAETDNDREWLPGPHQPGRNPLTGVGVTAEVVEDWHTTLDTVEALLTGELLAPHWRFPDQGLDLPAFFASTGNLDLVLLLTGPGALPYLRDGDVLDPEAWQRTVGDFGPLGLIGTAVWFN